MKFKKIRLEKGMTQQQIADYLGCAPNVYSRYENGTREPSIEILIKLSHLFCVSIDTLVENELDAINQLSAYELALIDAARNADERARTDALNMLLAHRTSAQKDDHE